ncbi:glycosyltransferase [Salibacterium aidingense]|uniref:glycosyltransferase n=1 Tax=Salibacterium aidingense TaxID=384933 RepID=UPI003BE50416
MGKKVCMLVTDHPFLDSRIFKREALSLKKMGYEVTMIVPRKNKYLLDIDGTPIKDRFLTPSFKYKGITIITYDWESSRAFLSKVRDNPVRWEHSGFHNQLTQLGMKQNADIYHVHEYLSLFAGVGIKHQLRKKGKEVKLIYDSHELTPDPFDPNYTEEIRNILKERLLSMLKEVDYVITISPSIKSWFLVQNPAIPVEIIYNSPPLSNTYQPKKQTDSLTVCYEGNMDNKRGSKEKITGITEFCSAASDFKFKVIGGARFGDSFPLPQTLTNKIHLTGWVDYHAISNHMADVDAGWIDYEDLHHSLNRLYAMPNKFFSYLNNGVPVVVNRCHEMENFIRKHHCGLVLDKADASAQDYAEAFLYLNKNKSILQQMSENARAVMENKYSWEHMQKRLANVYEELLNEGATMHM